MNLLLIFIYTSCWFLLHFSLQFFKSKYLKTKTQQNNFVTTSHAFLVPLLTLGYFLLNPEHFGYETTINSVIRNLYCMSIGFYVFSTINLYRAEKKPEVAMIVHHWVVGGFLLFTIYIPNVPAYFALILVPQCTAFVFHTLLMIKELPDVKQKRIDYWYNLNYYVWIVARFLVQAVFTFFAFYYEFTQFKLTVPVRVAVVIGFLFSYYFNVHWLMINIKNRRKKRQKAALEASNRV